MSPFIAAEVGAAHNGKLKTALQLVDEAGHAGADAIKLQTFDPDKLVGDKRYIIKSGPWKGRNLIELYREARTPRGWNKTIFEAAKEFGMKAFSTPFHQDDVDYLEKLDCPIYKISSFDIINIPLISYVTQTGKPLIISTGMASSEEIQAAVAAAGNDLTLLHCISSYPAPLEDANLSTMTHLQSYGVKIGISDHSKGIIVPIAATVLGAQVIEKHITLDEPGLDRDFALLPYEFDSMVESVRRTSGINGIIKYGPTESEYDSYKLRPTLYWAENLKKGIEIKDEHFKFARPALGKPLSYKYKLIGTILLDNVSRGQPVE